MCTGAAVDPGDGASLFLDLRNMTQTTVTSDEAALLRKIARQGSLTIEADAPSGTDEVLRLGEAGLVRAVRAGESRHIVLSGAGISLLRSLPFRR